MKRSLLPALLLLAACGADAAPPTAAELYGTWTNLTDGTHRAFVFAAASDARPELAGLAPTYLLYNYPVGSAAVLRQAGRYAVEERTLNEPGGAVVGDALVTTVAWDEAGTQAGQEFGNRIVAWDGVTLSIQVGDLVRTYGATGSLP